MTSDQRNQSEASNSEITTGRVKWFNGNKGYGFVVSEGHDSDVLIPRAVLNAVGVYGLPDGTWMQFVAETVERGFQVTKVLALDYREAELLSQSPRGGDHADVEREAMLDAAREFEPVEVKWFDWASGYGFLYALDRNSTDVFVHADVLRSSGIHELQPGDRFEARIAAGKKGLTAVILKALE